MLFPAQRRWLVRGYLESEQMFPWSWLLTKLPFLWFPLPTLNELMLEWEQAICDFGPWIIRSWTTDYATSLLAYRKSGNTTTDIATSNPNSVSATTLFFLSFLFLPCLFILLFSLLLQISSLKFSHMQVLNIQEKWRQATRPPFCYQSKQGVFFLSFLLKSSCWLHVLSKVIK